MAALLDLFCHLALVRLLLHSMLSLLALLFVFELRSLHVYLLADSPFFLNHDLLLLCLKLDLHVEHFFHFLLLLLASLFFGFLHCFLVSVLFLAVVIFSRLSYFRFLVLVVKELVRYVRYHFIRLRSPLVRLMRLGLKHV